MRRKGVRADQLRRRLSTLFYEDRIEPVTPAELLAAQSHGQRDVLEAAPTGAPQLTGGGRHLVEPTDPDATDRSS